MRRWYHQFLGHAVQPEVNAGRTQWRCVFCCINWKRRINA